MDAEPFTFAHRLTGHPAFTVDALAELLDRVPRPWTLHQNADRDLITPQATLVDGDGPLGGVVRELEHTCRWLVTRHLELVGPYRELLHQVIDETLPLLPPAEGETRERGAMLVLGSPDAVVPVHLDRHHNFLLQIEGEKEFSVGWFTGRRAQGQQVGRNFEPAPANPDRMPDRHVTFHLGPGDGVYVPPYAFHWVSGGTGRSAALSCAFRTEVTQRAEAAQQINAALRRRGVPSHTPPGAPSDALKLSGARLYRRLRRRSRGG